MGTIVSPENNTNFRAGHQERKETSRKANESGHARGESGLGQLGPTQSDPGGYGLYQKRDTWTILEVNWEGK